jgi:cation:H+ antiporter
MSAIISGNAGISIGNLIGSNITHITLVVGIAALLGTAVIGRKSLKTIISILFLTSIIPLALLSVSYSSKIVGVALILVFVIFSYYILKQGVKIGSKPVHPKGWKERRTRYMIKTLILLIASVLGVVASSKLLVDASSSIALELGIAGSVIGASILALGTNFPELSITFAAVRSGHAGLALGDNIGATLTNISLVLGFVLISSPFNINIGIFETLIFFALITNLVLWFFVSNGKLSRTEGILLMVMYAAYLAGLFGVQLVFV